MRAARPPRAARGASLVAAFALVGLAACAPGSRPDPAASATQAEAPASAPSAREVDPVVPPAALTLATGSARDTDHRVGRDLATFVAPDAGIALEVRETKGSAENMHLLHADPKVALAIVQYDVIQALREQAAKGNAPAKRLVDPLRVVMPLYTQEIYFVVRRDSPLRSINAIRGRRINIGPQGSGSALTVAALYERLFKSPLPARDTRYLPDDQALAALAVDRSVDVVAVVAGQPARLFADMKPQARDYIRLLPIDESQPSSQAAYRAYFPATIRAASYANWLEADVPTYSVMSFLVTTTDRKRDADPALAAFARSICRNIGRLRSDGHPKWREVVVGRKVGFGFTYASASDFELARCNERAPMSAAHP